LEGTYYEPFLGGGAVFFHLRPRKAVLSDISSALVETYIVTKAQPQELLTAVRQMRVTKQNYDRVRDRVPRTALGRAARFLYLNRTGFGGMYRVNQEGYFNVPYGGGNRTPAPLWERRLVTSAAAILKKARLESGDFEGFVNRASKGDVVYCDPTYTVAHSENGFVRYNEKHFSWADQERLAAAASRAARRGAIVLVSNAHHPSIRRLYPAGEFYTLKRWSGVSAEPTGRREVKEYLIALGIKQRRMRAHKG
jgi:DNA adenine methylase